MIEELLKYGPLILSVIGMVGGVGAWAARKSFAGRDDVSSENTKLHKRINQVSTRLELAEQRLAAVPGVGEVGDLKVQLATIHGDYKAMAATMVGLKESLEGIQAAVQHISEHLLNTKVR